MRILKIYDLQLGIVREWAVDHASASEGGLVCHLRCRLVPCVLCFEMCVLRFKVNAFFKGCFGLLMELIGAV